MAPPDESALFASPDDKSTVSFNTPHQDHTDESLLLFIRASGIKTRSHLKDPDEPSDPCFELLNSKGELVAQSIIIRYDAHPQWPPVKLDLQDLTDEAGSVSIVFYDDRGRKEKRKEICCIDASIDELKLAARAYRRQLGTSFQAKKPSYVFGDMKVFVDAQACLGRSPITPLEKRPAPHPMSGRKENPALQVSIRVSGFKPMSSCYFKVKNFQGAVVGQSTSLSNKDAFVEWPPLEMNLMELCQGDEYRSVSIAFFGRRKSGSKTKLVACIETTVKELRLAADAHQRQLLLGEPQASFVLGDMEVFLCEVKNTSSTIKKLELQEAVFVQPKHLFESSPEHADKVRRKILMLFLRATGMPPNSFYQVAHSQHKVVGQSIVLNDSNPQWPPVKVDIHDLCEWERLTLFFYYYKGDQRKRYATIETTVQDLILATKAYQAQREVNWNDKQASYVLGEMNVFVFDVVVSDIEAAFLTPKPRNDTQRTSRTRESARTPLIKTSVPVPTSLSFSPAGVIYCCYHLGAATVLNKIVDTSLTTITGVSAGSLTAAAMKFHIPIETCLGWIIYIGRMKEANENFSLVDELERLLPREFKRILGGTEDHSFENYDREKFKELATGLRVGLSLRRSLLSFRKNRERKAFCYVDSYRDVDDLVAALLTSCFIPGATGPKDRKHSRENHAIARASNRIKEMEKLGFIKTYATHEPVSKRLSMTLFSDNRRSQPRRELYVDGSLTRSFPVEDSQTLVVTTAYLSHRESPIISPTCTCGRKRILLLPNIVHAFDANIFVCKCNLEIAKLLNSRSMRNSDVKRIFDQGRIDALEYFGITKL